jgi:hypothetical protein
MFYANSKPLKQSLREPDLKAVIDMVYEIHLDPASPNGDYIAKTAIRRRADGSIEVVAVQIVQPNKPLYRSTDSSSNG